MPFTEQELRTVLEDNSAEVPPVSDLTGNAERQGHRIRRRRYAAGAVAVAGALAIGVLTLPGLIDDGGHAKPVADAISPSTSPSPQPIHVDVSVLAGTDDAQQATIRGSKILAAWAAAKRGPAWIVDPSTGRTMTALANVVVSGTVEGFTTGQMPLPGRRPPTVKPIPTPTVAPTVATRALTSVVMRVRVEKTITGSAPGAEVYVRVGSGSNADLARFQTAIPAGARLVAFLSPIPPPLGDGGDGTGHPAGTPLMDQYQGAVFEDQGAGGTKLVGGSYQRGHLDPTWGRATTIDQLVVLVQRAEDRCAQLEKKLPVPSATADGRSLARNPKTGPGVPAGIRCRLAIPVPTRSP